MLLEDDPIKNIQTPMDYRYMRVIKGLIQLAALWPNIEDSPNKFYKKLLVYCIFAYYIICLYFNFLYLYKNYYAMSIFDNGLIYLTIFLTLTSLSRNMTIPLNKKYIEVMKRFFLEFHLFYFKNESEYALKIYCTVHKISHYLSVYYIGVTVLGTTMFNISSVIINYSKGMFLIDRPENETFALSLYYEYPWDLTTIKGYIGAVLCNWSVSFICALYLIIMDLLISLMVLQVWGHIKILLHKLKHFPKPGLTRNGSQRHYNRIESIAVKKELRSIIKYHKMIVEFTRTMSNVFGLTLFIFYTFHQISGCLLLLEVSPMTVEAVMSYGFLTATEFQLLIQLSYIFESIGMVSEKLKDQVYNLPWEYMDENCKKIVLIFLMNVKEPIHLKALGFTEVGVTTMAAILKTSFSYFLFLRTIN